MKRTLLIFFIFCVATLSAQEKTRVACIGNSITQGWGAKDMKSYTYPIILQNLLGEGYEVRNYGIGGRTALSKGDRPYIKEKLYTESQQWQPNIVIIKLGTNDSKPANWDKLSGEFETDLKAMVDNYKNLDSKPKIYLCEPVFIAENPHMIREEIVRKEIIPIIHRVAKKCKVEVIELHKTLKNTPQLLPDGVHPNDLGYVLIAKDIFDKIK